jgi:putative transposase
MPRFARAVIPDCPHHITQRGNNRQDVFFVPDDYGRYLAILREQSRRYGLDVHSYCLMTNHVHLVATPHAPDSLAKAVGRTHWLYSQTINRLHGRSGHLWQGRFYSCALDDKHFWAAVRYVERNPVRARLHRKAWLYAWSSAAAHCGQAADATGLLDLRWWRTRWTDEQWQEQLMQGEAPDVVARLRSQTHRGRPLGSDRFLSKAETLLGRRVRALPVGRPPQRRKRRPK